MKQKSTDQEKYSKEVEEILHKRPAFLVRKGILILAILVALLLAGSHFIKYPEQLAASVIFRDVLINDTIGPQGQIILTAAAASLVEPGQPVRMVLQPAPGSATMEVNGTITALLPVRQGEYYTVLVWPESTLELMGFDGTAYISIGEKSLLSKILNPVFAVFRSADR
ncbi:MAG: hypothetical protein ISS17_04420 [Bacteroidales bacterium]|nr:hypothetical protein [Bacteroidales bacterium]